MKCPNCKLINPPTALRCDCGWDFPSNTMQLSYVPPDHKAVRQEQETRDYWKDIRLIVLYSVIAIIALSIIATINGVPPEQHRKLAKLGVGLGVAIWLAKRGLNVWHWPSHWWPKKKTGEPES